MEDRHKLPEAEKFLWFAACLELLSMKVIDQKW